MHSLTRSTTALDVTRAFAGTLRHLTDKGTAGGFAVVGPSAQARMANAYASLPDRDERPHVIAAYVAFRDEVREQAQCMRARGWTFTVTESDPYPDARAMMADTRARRIAVLSTAVTGAHPFLSDRDNDLFRAVHDVMGHAATGRAFDRHGEEAAYRAHAAVFSPLARRALVTETRAQNAALIANGGTFAVQKLAVMPEWCERRDALTPSADEMPDALAQALTMHASAGLDVS